MKDTNTRMPRLDRLPLGRKPRLLFIAYDFPPINSIGCVRAYNIAKWLTRKGWEVTVVTPFESAWRQGSSADDLHDNLSRQGIRCMRTEHFWRSLLPLPSERRNFSWALGGVSRRVAGFLGIEREAGWLQEAERACTGLMPDDVDIVLASGPPFGAFDVARRVAARIGRPFIMDYRDLWTGNPHAKRPLSQPKIEIEREILSAAAAATGVSPSLGQSLREQFGVFGQFHVISNGFDPEEMAVVPKFEFGHPAIVYAGVFYPPKRTADPLMAALALLEERDKGQTPWAFHYYGYQGDYVLETAAAHGVASRVINHGRVPRSEALSAVRGASAAVVISSVFETASLQDRGIVTGKVFEAIGLGTPLLVIAPEGSDLEGVLSVTGLGKRFAGPDIEGMERYLRDVLRGRTAADSRPDSYSWDCIVEELDRVLREAARGA